MKKYVVEFIGTFFLVLTVGLVVRGGVAPLGPLAIAAILMVMVFAGGHVSGAHYNPAVTLAVYLRGRCDAKDVLPYWISQFIAAVVAGFLLNFIMGARADAAPAVHDLTKSCLVEFLFTFALAWVVLNVATSKGTMGNSFYGLAIGFTVLVGAITVGGISGGAFNPAVGLGVWTMGFESAKQFVVYLVSDFAGAAVGALAYRSINGLD